MTTAISPHADHAGLAPLASRLVDVPNMPWRSTRFPGIEVKPLLRDDAQGLATVLMRMAPGACLPDHEQIGRAHV